MKMINRREEKKMRSFSTIFKFEMDNYFKSKSYIISTILTAIIAAVTMFVPRIVDSFKGDSGKNEANIEISAEDMRNLAIYAPEGMINTEALKNIFPDGNFQTCETKEQVKELVENETAEAGFVINSATDFDYYVFNKRITDNDMEIFKEYMQQIVRLEYCQENNLDYEDFMAMEYTYINANENILGKDGLQNYWYCYILVIIVFLLVIMYGVSIASGVTNEKSNRSIEILVTSTSSNSLLFGKVFAGAVAMVFQAGVIAIGLLGAYQFNKEYWGDTIKMFLDIPTDVLVIFAIFGIGGFLFYAFIYGALGALVSKIEDLNKSAGTAQMIVTVVYMVVLLQLQNVDGIVIKVCSYLPISSYSAMFARVAMGNVAVWEIVLSAVILYASVIGMGFLGGKIFRSSTLRYGNPIKLSNALKSLKRETK